MKKNSREVWIGLIALGFLAAASGRAAASTNAAAYTGCDGYGAATDLDDGMVSESANLFRLFTFHSAIPTDKQLTARGSAGIMDCDDALADLPAKHWMRKVSLLRARALHQLDAGNAPGALSDLDLADATAAGHTETFYARSLGVGLDIVRAYALRRSGDQAKADATALKAFRERPYNRQTGASALLAIGINADPAAVQEIKRGVARLVPTAIDSLFQDAYYDGRFADMIAIYPQLVAPKEIGDVNISSSERAERDWRDLRTAALFWASRTGLYAYALATTGRSADARAAMQSARDKLAADTAPPLPLDAKRAKDPEEASLWQGSVDIRARAAAEAKPILDELALLVERRIAVSEGHAADVEKTFRTEHVPLNMAGLELLDAIALSLPKKMRPPVLPSVANRKSLDSQRAIAFDKGGVGSLFRTLPDTENASRVPSMSAKVFLFKIDGFSVKGDGEVKTVGFRGQSTTNSIVEELALLRAAQLARESGKKGLIVLARRDTKYTIYNQSYGVTISTNPNGYSTELDVVLVDPGALPASYQGAEWRVIDADAVYAALAPVYMPPAAHAGP